MDAVNEEKEVLKAIEYKYLLTLSYEVLASQLINESRCPDSMFVHELVCQLSEEKSEERRIRWILEFFEQRYFFGPLNGDALEVLDDFLFIAIYDTLSENSIQELWLKCHGLQAVIRPRLKIRMRDEARDKADRERALWLYYFIPKEG